MAQAPITGPDGSWTGCKDCTGGGFPSPTTSGGSSALGVGIAIGAVILMLILSLLGIGSSHTPAAAAPPAQQQPLLPLSEGTPTS